MSMVETRCSLLQRLDDISMHQRRGDRSISASETFACGHDIRTNVAVLLKGEECTASPDSTHYFVKDKKNTILSTDLSNTFKVSSWRTDTTCCCATNCLCNESHDGVWTNGLKLCLELVD